MSFNLSMPKLSPTMEDGTLTTWHKKEGEFVNAGDLIFEVATDKATVEHNALDEGWLRKILVPAGSTAIVGQNVAIFTAGEKDDFELPQKELPQKELPQEELPQEGKEKAQKGKVAVKAAIAAAKFVPMPPLEKIEFAYQKSPTARIKASPLAKKLAEKHGLDLTSISGTGPGGRIVERDLARAQKTGPVTFSAGQLPEFPGGSYEEETLTPMRKTIGKRLQEAKTFIPHIYVAVDVNVEPLIGIREQLKSSGIKVSVNDLVMRGVSLSLRAHPEVNSGYNSETDSIIRFKTIDISVAVSLPEGLITPIVRHSDYKNVGEIAAEIRTLAARAKEGKLQPHEYQGGSFTVSNLGMFGVADFSAILNPPQAAILAVSAAQDKAVVRGGKIVPGKEMRLRLSADHRVIDGADAARFLKTLKGLIEKPALLLI